MELDPSNPDHHGVSGFAAMNEIQNLLTNMAREHHGRFKQIVDVFINELRNIGVYDESQDISDDKTTIRVLTEEYGMTAEYFNATNKRMNAKDDMDRKRREFLSGKPWTHLKCTVQDDAHSKLHRTDAERSKWTTATEFNTGTMVVVLSVITKEHILIGTVKTYDSKTGVISIDLVRTQVDTRTGKVIPKKDALNGSPVPLSLVWQGNVIDCSCEDRVVFSVVVPYHEDEDYFYTGYTDAVAAKSYGAAVLRDGSDPVVRRPTDDKELFWFDRYLIMPPPRHDAIDRQAKMIAKTLQN